MINGIINNIIELTNVKLNTNIFSKLYRESN